MCNHLCNRLSSGPFLGQLRPERTPCGSRRRFVFPLGTQRGVGPGHPHPPPVETGWLQKLNSYAGLRLGSGHSDTPGITAQRKSVVESWGCSARLHPDAPPASPRLGGVLVGQWWVTWWGIKKFKTPAAAMGYNVFASFWWVGGSVFPGPCKRVDVVCVAYCIDTIFL